MTPKIIGLTGGIGSGKTTIAKYFASLGIPVYIADEEAKKILNTVDVVAAVTEAFGDEILTGGLPDREKLSALVFADKEKLGVLNGIIHPAVKKHFLQWVSGNTEAKFVIKEAAILFETGTYKDCDKIILVTAPEDVRIKRVMERDGVTREKVLERIENQWDDATKKSFSDYIIQNIDIKSAQREADEIVKILNKI